jgi:predicted DNA-binding transcriptional regulator YafY
MAKKLAYERFYWFHCQIKAEQFPNARKLAEKFEISHKQAQRDIEFMRDRLKAPLVYIPDRRGYIYDKRYSYEFPPIWLDEEELLALFLALRLASTMPDRSLKNSLKIFLQKFLTFRSSDASINLVDIEKKVSVKNIQYYRVDEMVFHKAINALFRNLPLKILYYSPHKNEATERIIQPLHLLCYMGSWHLISFCTMRNALRDFALSRIHYIEPVSEKISLPNSIPSVKEYLRKNFGLISGNSSIEISLKFTPGVSKWISEQIWHSGQVVTINNDGSLFLKFPVSNFMEVKREILKYGSNVEVISPPELREDIRQEIKKMARIYR